jgi:hypothetical protein
VVENLVENLKISFLDWHEKRTSLENFNTATHGATFNHVFEKKFWHSGHVICLQWVQNASKKTFWAISPVSSVTILIKKNLVPPQGPGHSDFILLLVQKKIYWKKIGFFSKITFLTPESDSMAQKLVSKLFFPVL